MEDSKFKRYVAHCWRVLRITKKPDREEYKTIVKASALGIAIIGFVGFILALIRNILFPPF
jgi:protein transport protein SEC61 subunit gamma and related proteins